MDGISQVSIPSEPGALDIEGSIPLHAPELGPTAWTYVKEALDTNWVSSAGPFVDRFERMVAEYTGTKHAVATVSGTAALHVALLVAGVEPDDEVLVSDLTFIAPANAVRYVGAWPVFIDAEPDYWQMDVEQAVGFLETRCRWSGGALYNKTTGRRVRAVLPVHALGHPVDLDPILEVARRYDVVVIEDATESLGAVYRERKVGQLGGVACFSFNGNKTITTGGGGMIVTDRDEWAERARYLATQAKDDPVEYVHSEVGFNYRLSSIQAALGCSQMEQIDEHLDTKRQIAARYKRAFDGADGIACMSEAPWARSTFWLFTIMVDKELAGIDSRTLLRELKASGIESRPLWQPMHLSAAHGGGLSSPVSERLYGQALSLPSSVGLPPDDQRRVIEAVVGCLGKAKPSVTSES